MAVNLEAMSVAELNALIVEAQAAIAKRKDADKAAALAKLKAVAAESGFSLEELIKLPRTARGASSTSGDKRSVVQPKYADPKNPSVTWRGRGKAPKWVVEFEASGKRRDALLIGK